MNNRIQKFKLKYFDKELDFRIRLFNVLALSGVIISFFTMVQSLIVHMWAAAAVGFMLMIIAWRIMAFGEKTRKYEQCYYITIVVIFLIVFPIMFFLSGGYRGGMPAVCIFAALFTMLMLDGWKAFVLMFLEMCVYIVITWICYYFPSIVIQFSNEKEILKDVQIGYVAVGVSCGVVVYFYLKEYNIQRKELKTKNNMLKQVDEAKSAFLNTVAHEVRNPLNIISLHAQETTEILQDSDLDMEQIKENQKIIINTVIRLDRILRDLMDTVSIEQGRLTLIFNPMRLEEVVNSAIEPWKKQYTNHQIKTNIQLDIEENLPFVYADYNRIYQVIYNLLVNSFRYTKEGTIVIHVKKIANVQQVCIEDNGEGMDEEIRQKAMEGYVSASKDYWRHGIGLYICHRIIDAHNGDIWIESKKNEGTKVYFTIPERKKI